MADSISPDRDFNMLSLVHLLEARDLYHLHLMNKANVVATAIGRYLIRRGDPEPPAKPDPQTKFTKRTLENSEARSYSWPCILVFVNRWVNQEDIGFGNGKLRPEEMVPKALHMPDGKVVPVCVVEAPRDETSRPAVDVSQLAFPRDTIGGGYPLIAKVQQQERVASIGCLVTDGHLTYALTNRHVSGETGERVYSYMGGRKVEIGRSSRKQITRLPFQKVYSEWPGKNVYVNLDVGLVEINDENIWTAQVYGLGQLGRMADLSMDNISLRLIGCPVRAYGCVSGKMAGQIHGLFYRYKTLGGFEYVADFLIGPRKDSRFGTLPGDSGTIWALETEDPEKGLMPIAVQWGGHVFMDHNKKSEYSYALATCLSTVCRQLDVDVIRDWNTGLPEYWGALGHYLIGSMACDLVTNPNLKEFMVQNRTRISFETDQITQSRVTGLSKERFVPLADVPDLVWKLGAFKRGKENPAHFADMDKPNTQGVTLLELCSDTANVNVDVWRAYYDEVEDKSRGSLPFRVWQIYQEMVDAVKNGDVARYLCAAGVLSHYVGDACQPLHISHMFNGDPNDLVSVTVTKNGETKTVEVPRADGVHSAYENKMLAGNTSELILGVKWILSNPAMPENVTGGFAAAVSVVTLMQQTFDTIQPAAIIANFNTSSGQKDSERATALWEEFGDATMQVIARGCLTLAMLWQSAWEEGDGDNTIQDLNPVDEDALIALYQDKTFLLSATLNEIGELLKS